MSTGPKGRIWMVVVLFGTTLYFCHGKTLVNSKLSRGNLLREKEGEILHAEDIVNKILRHSTEVKRPDLQTFQKLREQYKRPIKSMQGTGCECHKFNCGCCAHMEVDRIGLNDTGCVNVTYLPDQYGVSLTFSLDDVVEFNKTISAKNPPPICFGVPYLKKEASFCVDFYDLSIVNKTFKGCIKVEVRFLAVIVEDYDLGCFKVGSNATRMNGSSKLQANTKLYQDLGHLVRDKISGN